jgi:TetR/AcrR family transcriptional regulator, cholesterol catabolism regulator
MPPKPKPKTQPSVPADRRDQIRQLAAEMFFKRGYEATTMRELAGAIQIKTASLYYFFPNKEQILFELIESVVRQLIVGARHLIAREQTPEHRLAGLVVNHVVLHAMRPKESTLGDSELRSLTKEHLRTNIRHRDEYERLVLSVLDEGADARRFSLIEPKLTSYTIIAQSSHVGTWYRTSGRLSLQDVASAYVALALRTVAAEPLSEDDVQRLVADALLFHEAFVD